MTFSNVAERGSQKADMRKRGKGQSINYVPIIMALSAFCSDLQCRVLAISLTIVLLGQATSFPHCSVCGSLTRRTKREGAKEYQ